MNTKDQEVERRLEQFRSAAREAGAKLTHQRLEIFRAVASSDEHPSVEAVYKAVQKTVPTVSLDTVYRTLWLLTDLGLLMTLGPRHGGVRFDANLEQHHHFRCMRCGLVQDFESPELNAVPIPASVDGFGEVVSAHVEVRGICAECASELAEAAAPDSPRTSKRQR